MNRVVRSACCALLVLVGGWAAPAQELDPGTLKLSSSEQRQRIARLDEPAREFLRVARPIMAPAELDAFLLIDDDEERSKAISRFWKEHAGGLDGEAWRRDYLDRFSESSSMFESLESDRAQIYLLRGRPSAMMPVPCPDFFKQIEVWTYETFPGIEGKVHLLFYKNREGSPFTLLTPIEEDHRTLDETVLSDKGKRLGPVPIILGIPDRPSEEPRPMALDCPGGREALAALSLMKSSPERVEDLLDRSFHPRRRDSSVRTVKLESGDRGNVPLRAEVSYPGKRGGRTVTMIRLAIGRDELVARSEDDRELYALRVRGELSDDRGVADRFRYDYELPGGDVDELEVVIERFLPPYDYELTLHVQDEESSSEGLLSIPIEVPYIDPLERSTVAGERTAVRAEMEQQFRRGESSIRIVPLGQGFFTGPQRFDTLLTGEEISSVDFFVDDRKVMSKRTAPYTLELDLGEIPIPTKVRVVARNGDGRIIAGDQLVVNGGSDPFRVRIVTPRVSHGLSGETRVEVAVNVPSNHELESVELYLNDERVATGYESTLVYVVDVPSESQTTFIRAVATLDDETGSTAEDVVLLNAPEMLEQVDVRLVELPTTVVQGRDFVSDLTARDFEVLDEGKRVEIERFEYVRDLPLSIGMAMDSSGSMQPRMAQALQTGARFFQRVMRPGDRAFLLAFNDEPRLVQEWTDSLGDLAAGLATLEASEMTAMYDAVIHSLYNFQGLRGQKALVLLSDGQDTASKFSFDQVLEYSRRSGIPIYTIGLGIRRDDVETRAKLVRLAKETGAESYMIEVPGALSDIYDEIEVQLRSQYILGFYPSQEAREAGEWRKIEVKVENGKARTVHGYYP